MLNSVLTIIINAFDINLCSYHNHWLSYLLVLIVQVQDGRVLRSPQDPPPPHPFISSLIALKGLYSVHVIRGLKGLYSVHVIAGFNRFDSFLRVFGQFHLNLKMFTNFKFIYSKYLLFLVLTWDNKTENYYNYNGAECPNKYWFRQILIFFQNYHSQGSQQKEKIKGRRETITRRRIKSGFVCINCIQFIKFIPK